MRKIIILLALMTAGAGTVRSQTINSKPPTMNSIILSLIHRFYLAGDKDSGDKNLENIAAEDFIFTGRDGQAVSDKQFITNNLRQSNEDLTELVLGSIKNKFDLKNRLEYSDVQFQQNRDQADFKLTRTIQHLLTIKGIQPENFQSKERFAITGTISERTGKWLLSSLKISESSIEDTPDEKAERAKFENAVERLIDAAAAAEADQSRQNALANQKLKNEVRQFFASSKLTSDSAATPTKEDLTEWLTKDFILTSESSDGAGSGLFTTMPLVMRREAVIGGKLFITNRNLRVVQNGAAIVATYDTLYFSAKDDQKILQNRERHLSVFVRRGDGGKLLWIADHSAKIPDLPYNETPRGWVAHFASSYRMGIDMNVRRNGEASVYIEREAQSDPKKGVELSQMISAKNFQGKRVQLTAYMKSENLTGDASILLLVNQQSLSDSAMLEFLSKKTKMSALPDKKGIQGTNDWKPVTITIDVPKNVEFLAISALLRGAGKIWLDDFSIKTVGSEVPVDYAINSDKTLLPPVFFSLDEPVNLNFEDN